MTNTLPILLRSVFGLPIYNLKMIHSLFIYYRIKDTPVIGLRGYLVYIKFADFAVQLFLSHIMLTKIKLWLVCDLFFLQKIFQIWCISCYSTTLTYVLKNRVKDSMHTIT